MFDESVQPVLEAVLASADALCDELAGEIERLRDAGDALASLASDRIMGHARARDEFNRALARRQEMLADALERARVALKLPEMTLTLLTQAAPVEGAELSAVFTRIRVLAGRLDERDRQIREMLDKGLAVVTGYLSALRPPTQAYDRRGIVTEQKEAPVSTVSWRG